MRDCACDILASLAPEQQAAVLSRLAQQARLLEFSTSGERAATDALGTRVQHAIERAMDAESLEEADVAQRQLADALASARKAGMAVTASLGEMDIDGLIGSMKLNVLSAVLQPAHAGDAT